MDTILWLFVTFQLETFLPKVFERYFAKALHENVTSAPLIKKNLF